jgi:aldose 1-epimerase
MTIDQSPFGKTPDGTPTTLYTLRGGDGFAVKITDFGGRITEIHSRDRDGKLANVNLGHAHLDGYLRPGDPYLGALVGRVANRIARGEFELDGKKYVLPKNNGNNTLHGGMVGFDKIVWKAVAAADAKKSTLTLTHRSPDGDQGFPGNLDTTVLYTVDADRAAVRIDYTATTDAPTPVNLTNHAYFNLAGAGNGTVLDHVMQIAADKYTVSNDEFIATGEIAPVAGTPLDFRKPTRIGDRIHDVESPRGGYDFNYVVNVPGRSSAAARVSEPMSGRLMEVFTDEPGIQLYTGNFLDGTISGLGGIYQKHSGFCLETQHFPNSVHHAAFPTTILRPGQTYRTWTEYRFSVE